MSALPDDVPAVLAAFEARLRRDRDAGRAVAIADYIADYPGFTELIRATHARWLAAHRDDTLGAFESTYRADVAARRIRPLADYVALQPESASAVAARFAELESERCQPTLTQQLGPYRLLRELGRGGQGAVFLAEDPRLGRHVAIKVLDRVALAPSAALQRFLREATLASRFDHPGICPVHDTGHDRGIAYLVMRHYPGATLAQRLTQARTTGVRLLTDVALGWAESVARALHVAHEGGVVHRDLKPSNIILDEREQPVLLDFGLARADGSDELTLSSDRLGTPAYMAPEQAHDPTRVDRRCDVFALGAVLFELLTLRAPFAAHADRDVTPSVRDHNPRLSRDIDTVLGTALAAEPARRYATAAAFADDLERLRRGAPVAAQPASVLRRARWFARRRPALLALLGTSLVAIVGTMAWTVHKNRELRAALSEARWLADRELLAQFESAAAHEPRRDERDLPHLRAWLADAEALVAREAEHGLREAEARARGALRTAELLADLTRRARAFATPGQGQLPLLRAAIDQLAGLRAATIDACQDAWQRAAETVRADARFGGYTLRPQLGLVPLGADPHSGLAEFGDVRSGQLPTRGADGRLACSGDTGVVFVLVPPAAAGSSAPLLVAKHELTQGQYSRLRGSNPAQLQATSAEWPTGLDHPVENLHWVDCQQLLTCIGWRLPSLAEWQHAARGGKATRFCSGDDPESLLGAANLADVCLRESAAEYALADALPGRDGHVVHAPVGSFAANGYGLHDVAGNVCEWCADVDGDLRTTTGGSFLRGWSAAELGAHRTLGKWDHTNTVGMRPVRELEVMR